MTCRRISWKSGAGVPKAPKRNHTTEYDQEHNLSPICNPQSSQSVSSSCRSERRQHRGTQKKKQKIINKILQNNMYQKTVKKKQYLSWQSKCAEVSRTLDRPVKSNTTAPLCHSTFRRHTRFRTITIYRSFISVYTHVSPSMCVSSWVEIRRGFHEGQSFKRDRRTER